MNKSQLEVLIRDTLIDIRCYSESAVFLLMGTCAQESQMGEAIQQYGGGPALGIMQMEPFTFNSHTHEYLNARKPELKARIMDACNLGEWDVQSLKFNLKFSVCMTRVHYLRRPEALPNKNDVPAMAEYWKKYYNTYLGAGTEREFIHNYRKYVQS